MQVMQQKLTFGLSQLRQNTNFFYVLVSNDMKHATQTFANMDGCNADPISISNMSNANEKSKHKRLMCYILTKSIFNDNQNMYTTSEKISQFPL